MDGERFENLLRWLTSNTSRRAVTHAVAAVAMGTPLAAWLSPDETAGRKRRKKKKKKCKGNTKKCGKRCILATNCCRDADCPDPGQICRDGTCLCPAECCNDDACPGGDICQAGACQTCINTPCLNDEDCCWGFCDNPGVQRCVCITGGGNCTASRECCSRSCENIVGGVGTCACDPPGTVCFDHDACCSGTCEFPQGQTIGTCA